METNWYYIFATILSPIIAGLIVWFITRSYQKRKEHFSAKFEIFKVLMAARDTRFLGEQRVAHLNLIPIIFADNQRVLAAYQNYFNFTQIEGVDPNLLNNKYLLILEEISKIIGLKISIDSLNSVYYPNHLLIPLIQKTEIDKELLRVLQNTDKFLVQQKGISNENPKDGKDDK